MMGQQQKEALQKANRRKSAQVALMASLKGKTQKQRIRAVAEFLEREEVLDDYAGMTLWHLLKPKEGTKGYLVRRAVHNAGILDTSYTLGELTTRQIGNLIDSLWDTANG